MKLVSMLGKLSGKWQEANKAADDMGIPPVDHFLGISIPGMTHIEERDDLQPALHGQSVELLEQSVPRTDDK